MSGCYCSPKALPPDASRLRPRMNFGCRHHPRRREQFQFPPSSSLTSAFSFSIIAPPLPLKKVPVNPHRLDAARIIRLRAVHQRRSAKRVVRFYNQRGTAEQWIKEGKNAVKWTRLSCHDFVDNQVRLQLFVLAYNLGNFLRQAVLP